MQKIWNVALNDLRVTFADRTVWISLVLLPVVLIFVIGLANGGFGSSEAPRINVDVFDNDNGVLSAQFIEELRSANPTLRLCPMDNDESDPCGLDGAELQPETAEQRLRDNQISGVITIPAGFGEKALGGEPVSIEYLSDRNITEPSPVLQAIQAVIQRIGGASAAARIGVDVFEDAGFEFADASDRATFKQAVYDRADEIWAGLPETVDFRLSAQQDAEAASPSGFSQSVPGIGSMYVMGNVMVGALVLLTERKQWTLQRLMSMPVSGQQVIAGKMLARFIMGLIQYGVAFGFGLLLGVRFGDSPLAIITIMVAFTLCSTAFALLLATFVTSEQQAGVLLNLVILVLAPLGGAWWPLEIVPQWMQTVGHISPIAWAMDGFRAVIFNNGGLAEVVAPVGVLLVMTAVLFLLAIRRFKYE